MTPEFALDDSFRPDMDKDPYYVLRVALDHRLASAYKPPCNSDELGDFVHFAIVSRNLKGLLYNPIQLQIRGEKKS